MNDNNHDDKHDDAGGVPTTDALRDPVAAFGVGALRIDDGVVFAEQQLGPRFADHRGLIASPHTRSFSTTSAASRITAPLTRRACRLAWRCRRSAGQDSPTTSPARRNC
ncbi:MULTISPECIES: hypothetical protein [Gordonia]|uniref:Uncharacterized protein n=1 Tax=Gordonia sputi NBRC 100414 TaxID=1089453 RepID=H5U1W5_9ACTN|nr:MULTISPECIES: hypothetical protein [Gordonia]GAB39723.1 hypothetical protein GOSPT_075_00820 [Gordonia sputi NBRC 100414]